MLECTTSFFFTVDKCLSFFFSFPPLRCVLEVVRERSNSRTAEALPRGTAEDKAKNDSIKENDALILQNYERKRTETPNWFRVTNFFKQRRALNHEYRFHLFGNPGNEFGDTFGSDFNQRLKQQKQESYKKYWQDYAYTSGIFLNTALYVSLYGVSYGFFHKFHKWVGGVANSQSAFVVGVCSAAPLYPVFLITGHWDYPQEHLQLQDSPNRNIYNIYNFYNFYNLPAQPITRYVANNNNNNIDNDSERNAVYNIYNFYHSYNLPTQLIEGYVENKNENEQPTMGGVEMGSLHDDAGLDDVDLCDTQNKDQVIEGFITDKERLPVFEQGNLRIC
jgi:hypothetical protein